jgi:hypothetical protein
VHFGINKSTPPVRILAVCMGAAGAKGVIPVKQRPTRIHMPYSPPAARAGNWNWQRPALLLSPQCRNIRGNFRRLP